MAYYRTDEQEYGYGSRGRGIGGGSNFRWGGLLVAALFAGFAVCKYYSQSQVNEITGEKQHVGAITKEQEMALGMESAPHMAQQYGGLYPDQRAQAFVKQVGNKIVDNSVVARSGYQFDFHLLADPNVINAFALPGGLVPSYRFRTTRTELLFSEVWLLALRTELEFHIRSIRLSMAK